MRLIIFVFTFLISTLSAAQVPQTLSYQGLLTDASGNPVSNASHQVQFNFFTNSAGTGTAAFSRGPLSVTTYQGLFTVILGNGQGTSNAALPNLGSTQYYIQTVADGTALTPLVQLTAVPYAYTASALDANATISGSQINTPITNAAVTIPAAQITGTLPASIIPSTLSVPVGTILAYAGSTVPTNWKECDGSAISRTTFSTLFAAIGTTWGSGDASTTFNVPDLRGKFVRGWNHGSGSDPDAGNRALANGTSGNSGDNVGSYQVDTFQGHFHSFYTYNIGGAGSGAYGNTVASTNNNFSANDNVRSAISDGSNGSPRIASETRPKNAYVMYIIKYQ